MVTYGISFNIFRIQPNSSNYPHFHKNATYRSIIQRAFSIPLNQSNLRNESNTIIRIANNNQFYTKTMQSLINEKAINLQTNIPQYYRTGREKICKINIFWICFTEDSGNFCQKLFHNSIPTT